MKNKFTFLSNEVHVWFKVACQLLPTAEYDEDEVKNTLTFNRWYCIDARVQKENISQY